MGANFYKIRTLAEERGITLSQLAEKVGMTATGLGLLIKSDKAMTNNVEKIARELGVTIGYFFDGYEEPVASTPLSQPDLHAVIAQKDEIIAQKDKIIEQKDAIINIITSNH